MIKKANLGIGLSFLFLSEEEQQRRIRKDADGVFLFEAKKVAQDIQQTHFFFFSCVNVYLIHFLSEFVNLKEGKENSGEYILFSRKGRHI